MKKFIFKAEITLPCGIERVFSFFADARNLETLTPSWLRFKILSPGPTEMGPGALIDYRLRLHGFPIRWQSEITEWQPPSRFVDRQRRGPYRFWVHEHNFSECDDGTIVKDRVEYSIPGGLLLQKLIVSPDLEKIFAYRHCKLREIFGSPSSPKILK